MTSLILSVNFDLQVKYFKIFSTHTLLGNPTDTNAGRVSTGFTSSEILDYEGFFFFIFGRAVLKFRTTASLPWPVVVTIQSTVSFVFLAPIFYITIHFQLNFMFWGIICLNNVCST